MDVSMFSWNYLLQPQLFPLGQLRATCDLRAAFPLGHHFSIQSQRFFNSSQFLIIFNTQSTFVSWLNLITSLFTPFQFMNGLVSEQHTPPGDTTADQPLPQDLTMSSHSLFPVFFYSFLFYSSRDLSIYALTFLKSLWWEMLSAALRKYKLVISTGYPLSTGLLTPPENSRDYGRTSLYKSSSHFHSISQLPLHPIIPFFCCFLQSSSTIPTCSSASYTVEELTPHVELRGWDKGAPTGSVFSRLWLPGAGSAGVGMFFPEFPLSVYCWFGQV